MGEHEPVGWDGSAAAWIHQMADEGDYGRKFVLDGPMLERVEDRGFGAALDVGCGEGRFCRMLRRLGITAVGIDPTAALIERARGLDPAGDYRLQAAETMDVEAAAFDLVVSYLSLIDIADLARAASNMVDALRPGGTLLIANLTSFNTAGSPEGWTHGADGRLVFTMDRYLEERPVNVRWRGISVVNWHRPLAAYMRLLLEHGLELRYFDEPAPSGGDPERGERYRRVPWFYLMEWRKPMR
jgi:SAM-dependent methyltransferase